MELLIEMHTLLEWGGGVELEQLLEPGELLAGYSRRREPARAELQRLADVVDFRNLSHRVDNLDTARADLTHQLIANQARNRFANWSAAHLQSGRDLSFTQARVRRDPLGKDGLAQMPVHL